MGFSKFDYIILAVYLIATAGFGALLGRGQKTIGDYFLGGKRLPWWAISFSIVATETSTLTFIGAPAIAYAGDITFLTVTFGYFVGKVLVTLVLIPGYFRGEIQTAYEILNLRFGSRVRNLSVLIFQVTRTLSDGVRLFATALVLSVVTEMSDVWTVCIIGIVTVIYTFYGGMTAVVWTDVIQLAIYLAGAMLAFFTVLDRIPGGWNEVVTAAATGGKLQVFDFSLNLSDPYTFLAGIVGGAFLTFATHGTDQLMVQRYLACADRKKSQVALIASGFVVIAQFLLFLLIGVMLFAYYQHFPLDQELDQVDRIFPLFIVNEMPAGISGLVIAAIFAAAMSTLSGSLNSLASSSVNDVYRPYLVKNASDSHYFKASRVFTLLWGIGLVAVSFLAKEWGGVLEAGLTIASFTMGSVLGIFLLGIYSPRTDQNTGVTAMILGLAGMLAVSTLTEIAWTWHVLIGTSVTVLSGVVLTWAAGPKSPTV